MSRIGDPESPANVLYRCGIHRRDPDVMQSIRSVYKLDVFKLNVPM